MDLGKSTTPVPVPGWYADPEHPGSERYWDGTIWSDQRRPAGSSASAGQPSSNGFAITALVCGIIGVLTFWLLIGLVLGVIAIVFGVLARNRAGNEPDGRAGMATAGLVLGIVATVGTILYIVLILLVIDAGFNTFDDFSYCLEHPDAARCD